MNVENIPGTSGTRKRPRGESIEQDRVDIEDAKGVPRPEAKMEETSAPAYGSREYWEDRYKAKDMGGNIGKEDDPEPHHAWYFKFDDLEPILLPLIVGNDDDEDDIEEKRVGNDLQKSVSSHCEKSSSSERLLQTIGGTCSPNILDGVDEIKKDASDSNVEQINAPNEIDEEENDVGEYEEVEGWVSAELEDEEDNDSPIVRVGLAKNAPISVLEVGCGDAPLGRDLALSIQKYGNINGQDPLTITQKVVCLDYSKNVIDSMKQEQEQQQSKSIEKGVPVLYEVGDARKLCYQNESFEIVLEKGTLDAMLSDSDGHGEENCQKIVSECARVVTVGGYIVIISHLNAQVESGLEWLNNVILPGLRATGNFEWVIEVHGSEVEIPSDIEDDLEKGQDIQIESPGPAVYFIKKVGLSTPEEASDGSKSLPTIPLQFYTY